jgi:hypothetical protein
VILFFLMSDSKTEIPFNEQTLDHVPQSSKGGPSIRCDQYTYDQFINSSLDEMERLARTTPSPIPYSKKDMKGYMG